MSRASRLGTHRIGGLLCLVALVVAALVTLPAAPARAAGAKRTAKAAHTQFHRVSPPRLAVSAASLVDASTGQVLWSVNGDARRAIASTTKLMTALIVLQHVHHLGTMFRQNDWVPAAADSQIGLRPGERMSVHDLLLAMMLPSADDAAEDLAYNVGHHSVARFVGMMNAQARALHLTRTHYSTPVGLDTPGNYSSASDLDRLAAYDRAHSPFFRRLVDLPAVTLHTGRYSRYVVNRNDLVARYGWINGVKTGHTNDAGYVLVASATRWGMTLVGSVLGTSSEAARDENAMALLHYGFSAFHLDRAIRPRQVLARPPEQYSSRHAVVVAEHPLSFVVAKTTRVRIAVRAPKEVSGPLPRHAVVGEATVYSGRRVAGRVPLILARAVPAVSPVAKAAQILIRPSTLLLLMFAIGALVAGHTARRRRQTRPRRAAAEPGDS
ncbi:MAG TPA: D-alanyl-D-alanine carboxypeptidase family protein [Solirubrobacteraceae bacterium]|jgi:D-alanyl-D-alanine carboxypeptidase (penicillin-binding protein 5/6)|nr:D-alanyl-D-alanine carboxypeptidase family protein [Solirubrobacteraceae bacterium]